ncbi:MAG: hypothetical protein Q4F54_05060 [Coriobacteriia bacterium]|nr:hypothetical protein [Coriobacteriia bacterium]
MTYWVNDNVAGYDDPIPASYIPYSVDEEPTSTNDPVLTGTFIREIPDDSTVHVTSNNAEYGKFMVDKKGPVDSYNYDYIYTARLKVNSNEINTITLDNTTITAVPMDGYRFSNWTISKPESREGEMLTYNFDETYQNLAEDDQV